MFKHLNNFINEILSNTTNGKIRKVVPIEHSDKKDIIPLSEMEALEIFEYYFSETIQYALMFGRIYGEPSESDLLDENELGSKEFKRALKELQAQDTPILLYWKNRVAIKTNWDMLAKYWDNFFYYPEDAIIYVDETHIYFYNEMILKKFNEVEPKVQSKVSVFEFLEEVQEQRKQKIVALEALLEGIPIELQEDFYYLFYLISKGGKTIQNIALCKEYMQYYRTLLWSNTAEVMSIVNPYNHNCLLKMMNDLKEENKLFDKPLQEDFYEILKKLSNNS